MSENWRWRLDDWEEAVRKEGENVVNRRFLNGCYAKLEQVRLARQKTCDHHYVEDLIDLDPDRSVYVVYCDICEHVRKDLVSK